MPADDRDLHALAHEDRRGLARELLAFLAENKKWWLIPIALAVALLGLLVALSGSGAAPFLYTLF